MSAAQILVIDNAEPIRTGMKKLLGSAGYAVDVVQNGLEAIVMAKTKKYDVAFVDLIMDDMTGIEVCKKLLELSPGTYLVLTYDKLTQELREKLSKFIETKPRFHYLEKPFVPDVILRIVEQALKKEGY